MQAGPAARPGSTGEALAMLCAAADHLAGADWPAEGGAGQRETLRVLGQVTSKLTVAHAEALGSLGASGAHTADGHPSARAWLRHETRASRGAAREAELWTARLQAHPVLREALAHGEMSPSWAAQLAAWTSRLPAGHVSPADQILRDATAQGLPLYPDLAKLAQALYEAVKGQQPDPDDPGDGFDDRSLRLSTTLGGAGRLAGDLSASCAALLAQVIAAFGKNAGGGDFRGPGQRSHDALEIALRLALGTPAIPDSAGMKTRAQAVMSIADLLNMDGASALQDAWLSAKAGEPGWFFGPGAQAAACAADITSVITATPDWDVLSQMADVFLHAHGVPEDPPDCPPPAPPVTAPGTPPPGLRGPLSPAARLALERTLLAMAARALSGPEGLAGFLRARLLGRPFAGSSLILDIGQADTIPGHLRRAVILRDKHCQWPGGCDRPASQCEPHHRVPRSDGGPTSLDNLDLYCLVHHHHFIHRLGWTITKHPDGTRTARSPDGHVINSHSPRDHSPPGGTAT